MLFVYEDRSSASRRITGGQLGMMSRKNSAAGAGCTIASASTAWRIATVFGGAAGDDHERRRGGSGGRIEHLQRSHQPFRGRTELPESGHSFIQVDKHEGNRVLGLMVNLGPKSSKKGHTPACTSWDGRSDHEPDERNYPQISVTYKALWDFVRSENGAVKGNQRPEKCFLHQVLTAPQQTFDPTRQAPLPFRKSGSKRKCERVGDYS